MFDTGLGGAIFTAKHPFIMEKEKQDALEAFLKTEKQYDLSKIFLMNV